MPVWLILGLLAAGALALGGGSRPAAGAAQASPNPSYDGYLAGYNEGRSGALPKTKMDVKASEAGRASTNPEEYAQGFLKGYDEGKTAREVALKNAYDLGYQNGLSAGRAKTALKSVQEIAESEAARKTESPARYAEGFLKGYDEGKKGALASEPTYPVGGFDPKGDLIGQITQNATDFWNAIEASVGLGNEQANANVQAVMDKHTTAMRILLNDQQKDFDPLQASSAGAARTSVAAWLLLATQVQAEPASTTTGTSIKPVKIITTEAMIKKYLETYAPAFTDGVWGDVKSEIIALDNNGCPFPLWNGQPSLRAYFYGQDASTCVPSGLCAMQSALNAPDSFRPDYAAFEAERVKCPTSRAYTKLDFYAAGDKTVGAKFVKDNALAALDLLKRYAVYNPFCSAAYATQSLFSYNWMVFAPRSCNELDKFTADVTLSTKSESIAKQMRAFYESLVAGVATAIGMNLEVPASQWKDLVGVAWDGWNEGVGLRRVATPAIKDSDYGIVGLAFAYKYALDRANAIVG